MINGTIRVWKSSEGWGFIDGSDGDEYFFNIANVRKGQKISLESNVKFDVFQGQRGPEARNITLY
tara:strand:- start:418 stop:612 length:195 start_codon:yes stop_codon:yes gene_type:complete